MNILNQPYTEMLYQMLGEPTQEQLARQRQYLELRNEAWRREYKSIKAKTSILSSAKRRMITNFIKENGE